MADHIRDAEPIVQLLEQIESKIDALNHGKQVNVILDTAADPDPLVAPAIWYNSTEKALKYSVYNADNVTIKVGVIKSIDELYSQLMPRLDGEPNGFTNRDHVTLSWDDVTHTLTLAPAVQGGNYTFFVDGTEFTRAGEDSIQLPDVVGHYYVYYDESGALQYTDLFDANIILKWAFVSSLYWNPAIQRAVPWPLSETHGCEMPAEVHSYLHRTLHTQYLSGISLSLIPNGSGDLDTDCQFTSSAGIILDEDITHIISSRVNSDIIPVLYREGVNGDWSMDDTTPFPVLTTGTGRAAWNEWTGTTWQLTEVPNNSHVLAHVFAVPGTNHTSGGLIVVMGQGTYGNTSEAQAAAYDEISELKTVFPSIAETKLIATLIIHTSNNYANTVKSRFVSTDTGAAYVDWRFDPLTGTSGTSATEWGSITGDITNQLDLQAALAAKLDENRTDPLPIPPYTLGTLPDAATWTHHIIVVTDATGGPALAMSDGTNWLRVSDDTVVA